MAAADAVRIARERQAIQLADRYAAKWIRRGTSLVEMDADEIRAEAYRGAATALHRYREGRGASFVTFCVNCIQHAIQDRYRRSDHLSERDRQRADAGETLPECRLPPLSLDAPPFSEGDGWQQDAALDVAEEALARVYEEELLALLTGLPDARLAYLLIRLAWEELPPSRSAPEIGMAVSSAYWKLNHAVPRLRTLLAARGYGPEVER